MKFLAKVVEILEKEYDETIYAVVENTKTSVKQTL